MLNRLAKIREACEYARIGKSKLYTLINAGKIDAIKEGRSTLIDLNSIDRYYADLPKMVPRRKPLPRLHE